MIIEVRVVDETRSSSVRPYLGLSIVTTVAVLGLPAAGVAALYALMEPDPAPALAAAAAIAFGLLVTTGGAALWSRMPGSADLGFGELMLWGWLRLKRAEDRLLAGTRRLGLDATGQPAGAVTIPRDEQVAALKDLSTALESKDPYTHGHSRRVERHVYRTAVALGLPSEDVLELRKAAALHDVGKVRIPDRILRKPAPLSSEERAIVEEHVVVGSWMVSTVGGANVVAGVRHHHERWDGLGYPDGLSGYEIPLYARVIAVADAYDAITSTRPYRPAAAREEAVRALRAEAGRQFDPQVVEAFVASLPSRTALAGILVLLAFPRWMTRTAAVTAKRTGLAQLVPAVGATGAAVMIGAATFVPAPDSTGRVAPRVIVQEAADRSSDAAAADVAARRVESPDRKARRGGRARDRDAIRSEGRRDAPVTAAADDTAPVASAAESWPPGDPQPDRGRDCSNPSQPKGTAGGQTKHCGD